MPKQALISFLYYAQEMGILLLLITSFGLGPEVDGAFYISHLIWFMLIYGLVVLPLFLIQSAQKQWTIYLFLILFACGNLIWGFSTPYLLLVLLVPMWRISRIIDSTPEQSELMARMIVFCAVSAVCYLIGYTMIKDAASLGHFPLYMAVQFILLLFGVYLFDYIRAKERSDISVRQWLQGLSLVTYLGFGLGALAFFIALLLPYVRALLAKIPDLIIWFFHLPFITRLFEWLFGWMEGIRLESPEKRIEEPPGMDIGQTSEAEIASWLVTGSSLLIQLLIFIAIGYGVYVLYKNIILSRRRSVQEIAGERFKAAGQQQDPTRSRRKIHKARDEVRRLYQSLLLYAQKKGQHFPAGVTAREWVQPYIKEDQTQTLWQRINTTYEKRRYSKHSLTSDELETFRKQVKMAKKELNKYYNERHTKERDGNGGEI